MRSVRETEKMDGGSTVRRDKQDGREDDRGLNRTRLGGIEKWDVLVGRRK